MHVVFRILRQVVVDDVGHAIDMQAARGDIGRHHHWQFAALELFEQLEPLRLRYVPGQGAGFELVGAQGVFHVLGGALGVDKNQGAVGRVVLHQADQHLQLFVVGDMDQRLAHAVRGELFGFHGNARRTVHVLVGELHDAVRQRGREQMVAALRSRRHASQHETDVADEAEIEHAVGFVEHHHFDVAQRVDLLLEVVDQAARGADQDVDPGRQLLALRFVAGTAVDHRDLEAGVARQFFGVLVNLHHQLASRRENQRSRRTRFALGSRFQQAVENRQQKGRGLAGAGLRLAGDIASGQRQGQAFGLDRSAAVEAQSLEIGEQPGVQIELLEAYVG